LLGLIIKSGVAAGATPQLGEFLVIGASLNVLLFVFNLLPIPPLDGFSVLLGVLPSAVAASLRQLEKYGMGILFLFVFFLPDLGGRPHLRDARRSMPRLGVCDPRGTGPGDPAAPPGDRAAPRRWHGGVRHRRHEAGDHAPRRAQPPACRAVCGRPSTRRSAY